jgi:hypothetical protein
MRMNRQSGTKAAMFQLPELRRFSLVAGSRDVEAETGARSQYSAHRVIDQKNEGHAR